MQTSSSSTWIARPESMLSSASRAPSVTVRGPASHMQRRRSVDDDQTPRFIPTFSGEHLANDHGILFRIAAAQTHQLLTVPSRNPPADLK